MRHELDAREYKLLLNPERFLEAPPDAVARLFWDEHLKPLIDAQVGSRDGGAARHEGRFDDRAERVVRFWDTPDCFLTRADLALRERLPADDEDRPGAKPEITLKLRMPDLFVVAATDLPGNGGKVRTKFEEDIAPLEFDDPEAGKQSVVVPAKPSIRSRFARSTTQTSNWHASQRTLAGLELLFPTILEIVASSGARPAPATALISGPKIRARAQRGRQIWRRDHWRVCIDAVVFRLGLYAFHSRRNIVQMRHRRRRHARQGCSTSTQAFRRHAVRARRLGEYRALQQDVACAAQGMRKATGITKAIRTTPPTTGLAPVISL